MVRIREARRALREFHAQCFWYWRRDMAVTLDDLPEIIRGLRRTAAGGDSSSRRGWQPTVTLLVAPRPARHAVDEQRPCR